MSQEVFPVPPAWADGALMNAEAYEAACRRVDADPDGFWGDMAARLTWVTKPTKIKDVSFHEADFGIRWFWDGVLNVSTNCLDRHLPARANEAAMISLGLASMIRVATSRAAKPPNTTEWTAPMRAQASMAMGVSGIIGM